MGHVYSSRYEVIQLVARGGMAEVYLARDHMLDRQVAIKVLSGEFARDSSFVERFRREARAAANLNHPNIVSVYDWGEEEGTYFIVMEYVEGVTLRDLLVRNGPLEPGRAAAIIGDIAAGLGFAHEKGVVHRDVKPGNVLITSSGQVKVTDFGIARAGVSDSLTQTGAVMGTAVYFSPEQAQGLATDGRSDLYSLGVVLYESLTGYPPFGGDSPVSIAYKHVRETPVPPSALRPDLAPELETIILTLLAKDPDDRYPSADELRDDLARYRTGQPLAAGLATAMVAEIPTGTTWAAAPEPTVAVRPAAIVTQPDRTARPAAIVAAPPPRRAARTVGFVALFALLLVIIGVLISLIASELFEDDGDGDLATGVMPNIAGQEPPVNYDTAVRTLEALDLDLQVVREDVRNELPVGTVFGQDPAAGARLEEGDRVTLQVSSGDALVVVPDLRGRPVNEAIQEIEALGLEWVTETVDSTEVEPGQVLETVPPANSEIPTGQQVTLRVAQLPGEVIVPDVANQPAASAGALLQQNRLTISRQEQEPSDTIAAGLATRTDPPAGTSLDIDSEVVLFISSGPSEIEVPNVVGQSSSSAQSAIGGAGLAPATQIQDTAIQSQDGQVISQSPSPGQRVRPGSTVTITVGRYVPATTTTPTTATPTTAAPTTTEPTTPPTG